LTTASEGDQMTDEEWRKAAIQRLIDRLPNRSTTATFTGVWIPVPDTMSGTARDAVRTVDRAEIDRAEIALMYGRGPDWGDDDRRCEITAEQFAANLAWLREAVKPPGEETSQ
jgi:hypothetical protein